MHGDRTGGVAGGNAAAAGFRAEAARSQAFRACAAERVEQLMQDGEAAREAELLDVAIRIYREAVKLDPRQTEAR